MTVYRGMNQRELDAQYDQRTLVPDAADHMAAWARWSAEAIAARGPSTVRYGPHPRETMLVFDGHAGEGNGVHMHVHGGAWRALCAEEAAFVVEGIGVTGMTVAVVDFACAPAVSLARMVGQVRRAFAALARTHGTVFVSAHSSGCHLAALLLDPLWQREAGIVGALGGLVLASGVYDLEPVRLSARNGYLHLSAADVAALSPHRHLPDDPPPVAILWGDGELPEFIRQSMFFADAVRARGGAVDAAQVEGSNHFEMYALFRNVASPVCRALQAQVRQARP